MIQSLQQYQVSDVCLVSAEDAAQSKEDASQSPVTERYRAAPSPFGRTLLAVAVFLVPVKRTRYLLGPILLPQAFTQSQATSSQQLQSSNGLCYGF